MAQHLKSPIGLVAGSGSLPIEFAKAAKQQGLEVIAVGHIGESPAGLQDWVEEVKWVKLGQLGKILKIFIAKNVKQVCFAGGISRPNIFKGVRVDWQAAKLLAKTGSLRDDVILRAIAAEFERHGMQVISAGVILASLIPLAGQLTQRALTSLELADAQLGWRAAEQIGLLDIGQTVVVTQGVVSAVEAVEGTDKAILRAYEYAGPGAVVVKLSKPQQDLRLDLPTVGISTIETMRAASAKALVLQAGKCFILDPGAVVKSANKAGIAILIASTCP